MKHYKVFSVLAVFLALVLLIMILPAPIALSKETLDLSRIKGAIGDKVTVTGSGFSSGDKVYIYFSSEKADVDDDDIDDLNVWEEVRTTYTTRSLENGGDITASFLIPDELTDGDEIEKVNPGDYFIYATEREEGRILAKEEFIVIGITEIEPAKGPVGTEVDLEGVGFTKKEDIEVFFGIDKIDIASGDDETDNDGEFKLSIVVPKSAAGAHVITIEIDKEEAKTEFTVEPESTISATSGRIGDRVVITGSGFAANTDVTVTFGGSEVVTGETDTHGNLIIPFDVPDVGAGTYVVEAKDAADNSGKFEFTLGTDISISPITSQASPGHFGMDVTIYGTDFKPNSAITITQTSTATVFSTVSENDGSYSYTFKISGSKPGENIITVTDGVNHLQVTFFMESVVPATPELLLPAMNTESERPVTFEWKDVTDPSGVTYTLQVARDKSFDDMVIKKQELAETQYTMPQIEDEMLESPNKAANYWWRVKAVDGAGNESRWSSIRSFNIGSVSVMGDWLKYLLIGLGVLVLLVIVFFVGRRIGRAH